MSDKLSEIPFLKLTYELTSRFDEEERKAIFDPLVKYNRLHAEDPNYLPLNVLVYEKPQHPVGGLWGHTAYGWFVIELLFLPERMRGQGNASSILHAAETEAMQRGCKNAWLDTHAFQARGFYESNGYNLFGELPDYPAGHARYFMQKALNAG